MKDKQPKFTFPRCCNVMLELVLMLAIVLVFYGLNTTIQDKQASPMIEHQGGNIPAVERDDFA